MNRGGGFFGSLRKKISPSPSSELNYGNTCFMSFYAAAVTRISYLDDNKFIQCYNKIMGNVIPKEILRNINTLANDNNNLNNLFNDDNLLQNVLSNIDTYTSNTGQKRIDYVKMNMPQKINIITGEMEGDSTQFDGSESDKHIKYISLANSNYGNVYIVADDRMSNVIQVIFRGTYSAKTAGSYTKPTSLIPLKAKKDSNDAYLYGIVKITLDMINTIIQSICYLSREFLRHTNPNSVTILTFGHSLGGAMTTLFSYELYRLRQLDFYKNAPYNVMRPNILCVSLGAPRCLNVYASDEFCKLVQSGAIAFKRIVTKGDPVPGMPKKFTGFSHPCSSKTMKANGMREKVNEDCSDVLSKVPLRPKYNKSIKCESKNSNLITTYNPLSHTLYFYIMYSKAANIPNFFKGMVKQMEVKRTKDGQTVARVSIGNEASLSSSFFVLDDVRDVPFNDLALENKIESETSEEQEELTTVPVESPDSGESLETSDINPIRSDEFDSIQNGGGKVSEDVYMTYELFNFIIENGIPIQDGVNRNVLNPSDIGTEYLKINRHQVKNYGGTKKFKRNRKNKKRKTLKKSRRNVYV